MYFQSYLGQAGQGPTKRRLVEARANMAAGLVRGEDIYFETVDYRQLRLDPQLPHEVRLALLNKASTEYLTGSKRPLSSLQRKKLEKFNRIYRKKLKDRLGIQMPQVNPASAFYQINQSTGKHISWQIDYSLTNQLTEQLKIKHIPINSLEDSVNSIHDMRTLKQQKSSVQQQDEISEAISYIKNGNQKPINLILRFLQNSANSVLQTVGHGIRFIIKALSSAILGQKQTLAEMIATFGIAGIVMRYGPSGETVGQFTVNAMGPLLRSVLKFVEDTAWSSIGFASGFAAAIIKGLIQWFFITFPLENPKAFISFLAVLLTPLLLHLKGKDLPRQQRRQARRRDGDGGRRPPPPDDDDDDGDGDGGRGPIARRRRIIPQVKKIIPADPSAQPSSSQAQQPQPSSQVAAPPILSSLVDPALAPVVSEQAPPSPLPSQPPPIAPQVFPTGQLSAQVFGTSFLPAAIVDRALDEWEKYFASINKDPQSQVFHDEIQKTPEFQDLEQAIDDLVEAHRKFPDNQGVAIQLQHAIQELHATTQTYYDAYIRGDIRLGANNNILYNNIANPGEELTQDQLKSMQSLLRLETVRNHNILRRMAAQKRIMKKPRETKKQQLQFVEEAEEVLEEAETEDMVQRMTLVEDQMARSDHVRNIVSSIANQDEKNEQLAKQLESDGKLPDSYQNEIPANIKARNERMEAQLLGNVDFIFNTASERIIKETVLDGLEHLARLMPDVQGEDGDQLYKAQMDTESQTKDFAPIKSLQNFERKLKFVASDLIKETDDLVEWDSARKYAENYAGEDTFRPSLEEEEKEEEKEQIIANTESQRRVQQAVADSMTRKAEEGYDPLDANVGTNVDIFDPSGSGTALPEFQEYELYEHNADNALTEQHERIPPYIPPPTLGVAPPISSLIDEEEEGELAAGMGERFLQPISEEQDLEEEQKAVEEVQPKEKKTPQRSFSKTALAGLLVGSLLAAPGALLASVPLEQQQPIFRQAPQIDPSQIFGGQAQDQFSNMGGVRSAQHQSLNLAQNEGLFPSAVKIASESINIDDIDIGMRQDLGNLDRPVIGPETVKQVLSSKELLAKMDPDQTIALIGQYPSLQFKDVPFDELNLDTQTAVIDMMQTDARRMAAKIQELQRAAKKFDTGIPLSRKFLNIPNSVFWTQIKRELHNQVGDNLKKARFGDLNPKTQLSLLKYANEPYRNANPELFGNDNVADIFELVSGNVLNAGADKKAEEMSVPVGISNYMVFLKTIYPLLQAQAIFLLKKASDQLGSLRATGGQKTISSLLLF